VSPEGKWLRVNRAMCEIVGYSESELLSKTFQDITHPDDLDADLELVRGVLAGDTAVYQMDKRYIHASGRVVWVQLDVSLVRDRDGLPQHFIAQVQDITRRRTTEAQLRESEARFRRLASDAPLGIFQTDAIGKVVYANDTWAATCATTLDSAVGAEWFTVAERAQHDDLRAKWIWARMTGEPLSESVRMSVSGSDQARWIDIRLHPMTTDDGSRTAAWVGTATDITQLVEANDAITDSRDRAVLASQMKSQFLANMSHEIRTPMNGVVGMADLLADSPLSPVQRGHINALRSAAGSLLALLNDILDFAKIEAGK